MTSTRALKLGLLVLMMLAGSVAVSLPFLKRAFQGLRFGVSLLTKRL